MQIKTGLAAAGLLKDDVVPRYEYVPDASDANAVRNICASLEIPAPPAGTKLDLGLLNKAIRERGFGLARAVSIKERLYAAGVL